MSLNVASFPKTHEDFHFAGVGFREIRPVNPEFSVIEGSDSQSNLVGIVGESAALRRVLQLVEAPPPDATAQSASAPGAHAR